MRCNRSIRQLPWLLILPISSNCFASKEDTWLASDRVPVGCLNRTVDTGEHITDDRGQLQYTPFFTCNETLRPLDFAFGEETDITCTIDSLSDSAYHLLEFYIHNDAPLTCRVPITRDTKTDLGDSSKELSPSDEYVPLVFALSGALQLSHLHINSELNVLLHTTPAGTAARGARILAASAYSSPSTAANSTKVVIGDPLELLMHVRWYSSTALPPSTVLPRGLGGHVHLSTVFYCLVSCGAGVAISLAYFRGIELPQRLRKYGKERVGGERGGGYAFPGSGFVSTNGRYGPGKRD